MYRVIRIRPDGYDILTRSWRMDGWDKVPVFVAGAGDPRIKEYRTSFGALKMQAQLMRWGYKALVIDSATGE